jgi:hypothetical protein
MQEIIDKVNQMLAVDEANLDREIIRQTKIFSDIQGIYLTEVRKLRDLNVKQDKLKLDRWMYYNGKAPAAVYKKDPMNYTILKSDIDKYLAADALLSEMKMLVGEQEDLVKFLEDALKRIQSRGYELKTAIDWKKWIAGGN